MSDLFADKKNEPKADATQKLTQRGLDLQAATPTTAVLTAVQSAYGGLRGTEMANRAKGLVLKAHAGEPAAIAELNRITAEASGILASRGQTQLARQVQDMPQFVASNGRYDAAAIAKGDEELVKKKYEAINRGDVNNTAQLNDYVAKNWGPAYQELVARELESLLAHNAIVNSLAKNYQVSEQATIASMASVAEQLEVLDKLADKYEEERKEEVEKNKERARAEEASEEKKEKKQKKKKALIKAIKGKEVEAPPKTDIKLYAEAEKIAGLKENIRTDKGMEISEVIRDPAFQNIYEENRETAMRNLMKTVPIKNEQVAQVLSVGTGKSAVAKYEPVVQGALLTAYRKSLEDYYQKTPKLT